MKIFKQIYVWPCAAPGEKEDIPPESIISREYKEDCSYFALVLIPRDEIWWVPVSEVAGKKSICTNAEKDVLCQYRGNLSQLKASG